jgi:hypothetical protein
MPLTQGDEGLQSPFAEDVKTLILLEKSTQTFVQRDRFSPLG